MSNSGNSDRFSTIPSYPYSKSGIAPYHSHFSSTEEKDPFLNPSPSFLSYSSAFSLPYSSNLYSASHPPRPFRSSRPLPRSGSLQPQSPSHSKKTTPKHLNDVVDIAKVDAGEDTRTYIMLRNLPNRYRLDQVSAVLESAVGNNFTIVSMPVDPQTSRNLGYCFVQFASTADVAKAYRAVSTVEMIKSRCRTSHGQKQKVAKSASSAMHEFREGVKRCTLKKAKQDRILCHATIALLRSQLV